MADAVKIADLKLPGEKSSKLEEFCKTAKEKLGDKLKSMAVFGSVARGEYSPDTSDINLLLVLNKVDLDALKSVSSDIKNANINLSPLFMSEEDLKTSSDVFPVKFLDMKENYKLIEGDDVIGSLEIDNKNLRLRCEQEVKNMMLKLRKFYIEKGDDLLGLKGIMINYITPLVRNMKTMLTLKGVSPPADNKEIIEKAAAELDVNKDLLQKVYSFRESRPNLKKDELENILGDFMNEVSKIASIVDKM